MAAALEIMGAFQMQGFLWLAIRNKCLTADHLAKRGTAHPDNWRQWSTSSQIAFARQF